MGFLLSKNCDRCAFMKAYDQNITLNTILNPEYAHARTHTHALARIKLYTIIHCMPVASGGRESLGFANGENLDQTTRMGRLILIFAVHTNINYVFLYVLFCMISESFHKSSFDG